eukprot:1425348-Pleurochrysis_carterae.AAC.1
MTASTPTSRPSHPRMLSCSLCASRQTKQEESSPPCPGFSRHLSALAVALTPAANGPWLAS